MVKSLSESMAAGAKFAGQLVVETSIMWLAYSLFSEMIEKPLPWKVCAMHFSWGPTWAVIPISAITTMCIRKGVNVNTQTWTHAQIHIHAQIPAYVQLPALFQPCVLLQPSTHLCRNQAPCPAMISVNPLCLAEMLIITCRPCILSKDSNKAAMFYILAPCTLATRSQVYWKDHPPSTVPI